RPFAGGRVHVHARDAGVGERVDHGALDLLGAHAAEGEVSGAAVVAGDGGRLRVEAVVADHAPPAAVVRERYVALQAVPDAPAVAALDEGRVAASVEEQDRLLATLEPLADRGDEGRREDAVDGRMALRAGVRGRAGAWRAGVGPGSSQVHDAHGLERPLFAAHGELEEPVLAAHRVAPALERRRRAAEHADGPGESGAHDGDLPGVVAGRVGLLVRRLVLLVDDDGTEVGDGGEDRRAGAHRDPALAAAERAPGVVALAVGEG